jgi:acetyl-CoA acetyltransferase
MPDSLYPEKQVCITGIGQSEVGRPSSHSAMKLTVDAVLQALGDAGLSKADIDGIVTYPGASGDASGISPIGSTDLMYAMGFEPKWVCSTTEGHNHMGAFAAAIHAIAAGACRHVLIFRTVAQATARHKVRHVSVLGGGASRGTVARGWQQWTLPYHVYSTANVFALYAKAYFDKFGATSEQLGSIAVNCRRMAALNPNAIYRTPITIDDYLSSRMISSPLHVYDCDTHIDGSTVLILSHRDAARDLRNPPIEIEALGLSLGGIGTGIHLNDFTELVADKTGDMLWSHTDCTPSEVDFAQLYDGFSIQALMWLESLRFCKRGEAATFVEGGERIGLNGQLPLNTFGGQLSAGRFHGFGYMYEACLQLWQRAGERQIRDAKLGVVSTGGLGFGAMLLKRG